MFIWNKIDILVSSKKKMKKKNGAAFLEARASSCTQYNCNQYYLFTFILMKYLNIIHEKQRGHSARSRLKINNTWTSSHVRIANFHASIPRFQTLLGSVRVSKTYILRNY